MAEKHKLANMVTILSSDLCIFNGSGKRRSDDVAVGSEDMRSEKT